MNPEAQQKAERVISLGDRLSDALDADVAALESGRARDMRMMDPEVQQLSLLYGREAKGMEMSAKAITPVQRARLSQSTKRLHDILGRHARMVARMSRASEGMIRAVAEEVERRRATTRTYGRTPAPAARKPGAMLYNSVV
ncbi:MAG: hypothetical protein HY243_06705 [Proteobacteria bacterium]|nr:hypothetical protein [Pseudomonadota bacterium]